MNSVQSQIFGPEIQFRNQNVRNSLNLLDAIRMNERERKKWTEAADVYARERLCSDAPPNQNLT